MTERTSRLQTFTHSSPIGAGASAGLLWVAGSLGINYLFERKSFKLFAINGGYHTVQFAIIGLVLSLMPCKDCVQAACPQ